MQSVVPHGQCHFWVHFLVVSPFPYHFAWHARCPASSLPIAFTVPITAHCHSTFSAISPSRCKIPDTHCPALVARFSAVYGCLSSAMCSCFRARGGEQQVWSLDRDNIISYSPPCVLLAQTHYSLTVSIFASTLSHCSIDCKISVGQKLAPLSQAQRHIKNNSL